MLEATRYWSREPIGIERSDIQAAIVAHASAQPHQRKQLKLDAFLLDYRRERKPQTVQQMQQVLAASVAAFGE